MSRGRKAIPPDLKDESIYKKKGEVERQKAETPVTESAKLKPPSWLSDGAKKEWRRVVKLYKTLNIPILCDLDTAVLTSYCIEVDIRDLLYQKWKNIQQQDVLIESTTTSGFTNFDAKKVPTGGSVGESKTKIINPILKELERHNKTIRALAEQLALTPAGRAAYGIKQAKNSISPAEKFMNDMDDD